jgi:hypothetical protein
MDPFTGNLNSTKTKKLFFNASDNSQYGAAFDSKAYVSPKAEVRPEPERINPYAAIEERNALLDKAHMEAALISDSTQTLIKQPYASVVHAETVTLEDLPALVRQAAEAAMLKKMKRPITRR